MYDYDSLRRKKWAFGWYPISARDIRRGAAPFDAVDVFVIITPIFFFRLGYRGNFNV